MPAIFHYRMTQKKLVFETSQSVNTRFMLKNMVNFAQIFLHYVSTKISEILFVCGLREREREREIFSFMTINL